jgi:hypothetical protein
MGDSIRMPTIAALLHLCVCAAPAVGLVGREGSWQWFPVFLIDFPFSIALMPLVNRLPPLAVFAVLLAIVETVLPLTDEVLSLVAAYAARKILPAKYEADMRHIALATIAEVESLVSWNFKHIVRLEKIRLFNEVNVQLGYKPLSILSPREVTTYEGS